MGCQWCVGKAGRFPPHMQLNNLPSWYSVLFTDVTRDRVSISTSWYSWLAPLSLSVLYPPSFHVWEWSIWLQLSRIIVHGWLAQKLILSSFEFHLWRRGNTHVCSIIRTSQGANFGVHACVKRIWLGNWNYILSVVFLFFFAILGGIKFWQHLVYYIHWLVKCVCVWKR